MIDDCNNPGNLRFAVAPKDVYANGYTLPTTHTVVGFRRPILGEYYLTVGGRVVQAAASWAEYESPRFILIPLPKKLKITFVEKADRPVKRGEWYKYGDNFYQYTGEESLLPYKVFDRIEEQI